MPSASQLALRSFAAAAAVLCLTAAPPPAGAQYFGQNKVQYKRLRLPGPEDAALRHLLLPGGGGGGRAGAAELAERWYARLSRVLNHQFGQRQPLILYASHPHFEQTNVLSGFIGEGTGGVTELLKRRIVLPIAGPLAETDHVLGHELVHAFQFDITGGRRDRSAPATCPTPCSCPLWFIEGMAEYLSVGPVDPHTAMWMRDAVARKKLPTIRQLDEPRVLPLPLRPGAVGLRRRALGRRGVARRPEGGRPREHGCGAGILEAITGLPSQGAVQAVARGGAGRLPAAHRGQAAAARLRAAPSSPRRTRAS